MNWGQFILGFCLGLIGMLWFSLHTENQKVVELDEKYQLRVDSMTVEFQNKIDSANSVKDSAMRIANKVDTVLIEIQGNEMVAIARVDSFSNDTLKSSVIADLFY